MYARLVDEAESRLRELRCEEWEGLGLGILALGLAVAATQVHEGLALPLFFGGLTLWFFGVRALWRRWELVDRLAGEHDAYRIPEVLAYASREASMGRRRTFAALIRNRLNDPELGCQGLNRLVAEDLAALACELEDPELALDPACAVACCRMLSDLAESPLLNLSLGPADLRSCVSQIRSGFRAVGPNGSPVGAALHR